MRHSLHSGTRGWHLCRGRVAFGGLRTYTTPVNSESGKPLGSKLATPAPQGSKLVVPTGTYTFPSGGAEFAEIRKEVYIDKTQFIAPILAKRFVLLCRPRRFGKTLTVGMLQQFHGVEFRGEYERLFKVCGLVN